MHLVFLNQYYPPDAAPTGVMLQAVAEECARRGHEVTVICADGGYAGGIKLKTETLKAEIGDSGSGLSAHPGEVARGMSAAGPSSPIQNPESNIQNSPTILRLPATRFGRGTFIGKLADYASYYLGVAWTLGTMNPKPDRIVALTTPPYLSVLARAVSRLRGADHAHWVMDLYPDVMVAHGMVPEGGWKHRLLAGLARWGFGGRRCAAVLTLGPDMAARVEHRTSNTQHRRNEVCSGASMSVADGSSRLQNQQSTISNQPSSISSSHSSIQNPESNIQHRFGSVSWVPLWGGGRAVVYGVGMSGRDARGSSWSETLLAEDEDAARRSEHGLRRDVAATRLRAKRGWGEDELVIMYSGNMGLGHRFGEILEVAGARVSSPADSMGGENEGREEPSMTIPGASFADHRPSESGDSRSGGAFSAFSAPHPKFSSSTRFVFYGGGKRRGEIEAFMAAHPGAPVELHDYAPAGELAEHLLTADVHLVSLEPAWTGTMVPSKLQGIFAVGRPVVFVGSGDSSIGRWIEESGGGWVVAPGDVDGLRAAINEARDPEVRRSRGEAAGRFAKDYFDRETNVRRVVEILAGSADVQSARG